jgi:hypothetical protein
VNHTKDYLSPDNFLYGISPSFRMMFLTLQTLKASRVELRKMGWQIKVLGKVEKCDRTTRILSVSRSSSAYDMYIRSRRSNGVENEVSGISRM